VGDDRLGALVREHVAASGVQLLDAGPPGATASATATLDPDGAASYEFDLRWDPADLPAPNGYDLVHVGSIGAWMPPGSAAVAELTRRAFALGLPVGFDPNVRPSLAPPQDELRRRVLDITGNARIVKLSDEDAAALVGADADPEQSIRELAGQGPILAALTRGGRPSVLRSGEHRVEVATPQTTVVDTIGAGDTWMGALLAELLHRDWAGRACFEPDELRVLGEVAAVAAAINCSRPGADPPWQHELLDR
jgi:fructokinase